MDNQRIDECASYAKEVEGGCSYEERLLANDGTSDLLSLERHRYPHRFCHGPCVDDNTYGDAGPDASRGTDSSPSSTSFVTAPPTIVSRTTDSGGDGRTLEMWDEDGSDHYAPPHTRSASPDTFLALILLTLCPALLLEIADDQPSRLAKSPSDFLANRSTHFISRISSICIQVFVRRSHLPNTFR